MRPKALHNLLRYAFFLGLMPLLNSCIETVTEVDIPQPQLKLVVFSFLNPADSITEVIVSKSVSTVGKLNNGVPDYVKDATVTISDGTNTSVLYFDQADNVYRTKTLLAEPGKTYTLTAVAPGGFSVKAVCTVPARINRSLQISLDSMKQTGDLPSDFFVKARWIDMPGVGDYYKLDFEAEFHPTWPGWQFESLPPDVPAFTDKDSDGKLMKGESGVATSLGVAYKQKDLKRVNAYLSTCDKHYYSYHESLRRYMLTDSFAEPVRVYSNIEGGLGVFGAYQTHTTTLNF